jgi:hypothetical protein
MVCEISQQEYTTGCENPRMARIPRFPNTHTLPAHKYGASRVDLTKAAEAEKASIHWPDQEMVGVRTHIPMDVRSLYDRLFRVCGWSSAVF